MTILSFLFALIYALGSLSTAMTVGWLIWRNTRNSGWIDTTWTLGLGLTGFAGALVGGGFTERSVLVAALVCLWAGRLALHIAVRTKAAADDPRYARLIREWGPDAPRQMFWFAQTQAWVSVPLALSILIAAWNPAKGLHPQDLLGAIVLTFACAGEALADWQLKRFRINLANKGRVCDQGLWKFSRHPNYFFEWVTWLAYPIIAIDLSGGYPWGWLAILAPVVMYWLLVHVSGIPLLEQHMLTRSGDEFRRYQERTNAFFPGPPRRRF
ncbi:MAG: DUF1295 domain-containing protein [Proteobacteria bacterium]|nr:DUF1295 domain-containing protein [Pseudomonadota bacterium]